MTDRSKPASVSEFSQTAQAKSIANALLGMDGSSRKMVFSRALGFARDLITKPGGMDSGDRANFNYLLASGLDVNSRLPSGETLLIVACKVGDMETVVALRDRGANRELTDLAGKDARYWADLRELKEIVEVIDNQWQIPARLLTGPKVNEFAIQSEQREAKRLAEQRSKLIQLLRCRYGIAEPQKGL